MEPLPMPSDVKEGKTPAARTGALPEPPSAKMFVRLFIIPLLIAAGVIGVMLPISRVAGSDASLEQAIADLKKSGGDRTADVLVGPGSKQRYLAAQIVSMRMKEMMEKGMSEQDRVKLADQLLDVLENHTRPNEGEVQHFV